MTKVPLVRGQETTPMQSHTLRLNPNSARWRFGLALAGALMCGVFWYFAWSRLGFVSRYAFFPLWLGYIVLINGINEVVFADSLLRRAGTGFVWLFVLSVPFWWFFEYLNEIVKSWNYIFPSPISPLQYAIELSIDFSTVVPAVLSTAFLFYLTLKAAGFRVLQMNRTVIIGSAGQALGLGIVCLMLVILLPRQAFPLEWIAPFLIVDPLARFAGYPSLLNEFSRGRWSLIISIMASTLFTGFWWECWNFYFMPKWVYTVPYVGFWKLFEMPALGYIGYPFFGLIVFSYAILVAFGCFGKSAKLTTSFARAFDLGAS